MPLFCLMVKCAQGRADTGGGRKGHILSPFRASEPTREEMVSCSQAGLEPHGGKELTE